MIALVALALGLQWRSGAYNADLTNHTDEPAQFVTSLMVYDYVHTALGQPPMPFAQEYYAHHPKVAIGHWPPFFFVIMAGWFLLVGPSKAAALVLVALTAAAVAACIFIQLRRFYSGWLALLVAVAFLYLPFVQRFSSAVMADMLLTLLTFAAMLCLAHFLRSGTLRWSIAFAILASLAICTKTTAGALALVPIPAAILVGNWRLLRSWKLWVSVLIVLAVCAPVYVVSFQPSEHFGGHRGDGHLSTPFLPYGMKSMLMLVMIVGSAMVALAVMGAAGLFTRASRAMGQEHRTVLITAGVWAVAMLLFQVSVPLFPEPRFVLLAVPPILFLAAHTLELARRQLATRWLAVSVALPAAVCVGALFISPGVPRLHGRANVTGYGQIAQSISAALPDHVTLVSSDSTGEGALVAAFRLCDPQRRSYTLRANKVLADAAWAPKPYRLVVQTPEQLRVLLDRGPVRYLVIDDYAFTKTKESKQGHQLLKQAIQAEPEQFRLVDRFAITRNQEVQAARVSVYEYKPTRGLSPQPRALIEMQHPRRAGEASLPVKAAGPEASGDQGNPPALNAVVVKNGRAD